MFFLCIEHNTIFGGIFVKFPIKSNLGSMIKNVNQHLGSGVFIKSLK